MNEPQIKIWTWQKAPKEYKKLSDHGGDEDWVLWAESSDVLPFFYSLEEDDEYGRQYVQPFGWGVHHVFEDGSIVIIFAHA